LVFSAIPDLAADPDLVEHEAWLGEVEGIDLTLTFLRQKRDETQRLARITRVNLDIPSVQSVPPARRE
jgi:hypothetical protein